MAQKRPFMKILAASLILAMLLGLIAVVYGANTSSDPLVTLSYLTGTYKTNLLNEVNSSIAAGQKSLSADLSSQISGLKSSLSSQQSESVSTDFQTVTLSSGKSLSVSSGAQILFLSGAAAVDSAALSDTTAGTALASGGSLSVNHLYVSGGDCKITASGSVKMLVKQ